MPALLGPRNRSGCVCTLCVNAVAIASKSLSRTPSGRAAAALRADDGAALATRATISNVVTRMRTSRGNAANSHGAKPVIRHASSWRWSKTVSGNVDALRARQLKYSCSARRRAILVLSRYLRTRRRESSSMRARVVRPSSATTAV
eukprot:Amastigsp_a177693_7.p3 type:complete len:146 gc:universal Amastigsp_a177693_7:461-24(-)